MRTQINDLKPNAEKSGATVTPRIHRSVSPVANSPFEPVMHLQRAIGNQAVQRLLRSGSIQAKLTVGEPDDMYEQEADRVADQVMRMPDSSVEPKLMNITPLVQRRENEEEEAAPLQMVQRLADKGSIGHSVTGRSLIQRDCLHFVEGWAHPKTGEKAPAGRWCEKIEEAKAEAKACPAECFIYADGPQDYPYRKIPGYPCAHYVAHELGIKTGEQYEKCRKGFSVQIKQITTGSGKQSHAVADAAVNDVYIYPGGAHSGVVREVDERRGIRVEACAIGGGTYSHWVKDGNVWR